jgi:hypothetical protein
MLDSIPLQFVGVSSAEDLVAGDLGGDYLTDNITICEANNETVFWCVVFVLRLSDEAFASIVIGFTSTTALVLGLIPAAEVLVLHATVVENKGE